jgi:apolipoprotein N-acyltransferase
MPSQGTAERSRWTVPSMTSTQADEASKEGTAPAWAMWLCPLAGAALLYLSYFPAAIGPLGWVALVPLLVLVRLPGRPKRLYLSCWLSALAFHWVVLQWVRVADWMMYLAWGLLATYGSFYWPVALAILRWFDRRTRLPLVVTVPAVWVSLEYVRYGLLGCFVSVLSGSHLHDVPGGFAWYMLGHTQHDFLEMIQIADIAGAFGVTFLVAAVNALVFEILCARRWFRWLFLGRTDEPRQGKVALLLQGVGVAALLIASLGYGLWRMSEPIEMTGPKLALMQTNMDQRRRNDSSTSSDASRRGEARQEMAQSFADLAAHAARLRPDLLVTPETSYPGAWVEESPGKPLNRSQELADDMARHLRINVLLGMNVELLGGKGEGRSYNSSILIGHDGKWKGRYDKIHRVPFGEYIPLRTTLPFLSYFAPYDTPYEVSPGEQFTQFTLAAEGGDYTFGVMICYEDTDPAMARPYGGGGKAQTDFLLNVSNDGWFDGTSEHDQHLAICRFRAVECRRSVGRAVNMGISALIDPTGRVLAPELISDKGGVSIWRIPEGAGSLPVSRWREFKKVGGIIVGQVPLDGRTSIYARTGDWFAGGCLALVGLGCVGLFIGRSRTP